MKVAEIILEQLGGRRFAMFTGSKNFAAGPNYLSMKLARNSSGANYLKITLNSLDLYDMEFIKVTAKGVKTVKELNDIYNDQLEKMFTEVTSLFTKF